MANDPDQNHPIPDVAIGELEGSSTSISGSGEGGAQAAITDIPAGTHIGRYIIVERVGQGGMGVVFKAFDPDLNRLVALKLLTVRRASGENSDDFDINKTRMLREAQALAQLSHPNVVTVHDVGTHENAVFMAMELVEGKTLREFLDDPTHDRRELLSIMDAAGRGLAAAHKVGIVHRDFKPGNVIVGADGRVRVIDFGLARVGHAEERDRATTSSEKPAEPSSTSAQTTLPSDPSSTIDSSSSLLSFSLTRAGAIVGTPHYMALEQHKGMAADEKSDQFSFCVVLFEALYGVRPFIGRTLREMAHLIARGKIERPLPGTSARPEVPAWLDRITVRGLNANPALRFPSMEALLLELANDPAIARRHARVRRLLWAAGVSFVAFAALAAYGIWYGSTRGTRLCAGGSERLAGIWDDEMKGRVRAAFLKTERSYAQDTFERIERQLDRYAEDWALMRKDSCEATELMLRYDCLDRRLGELRALTELFATRTDGQVLDKAVQASLGLVGLDRCADVKALTTTLGAPEDPIIRQQVEAIRKQLAEADVLERTGKYEDGQKVAAAALTDAEATRYKPVIAESLFRAGSLLEWRSEFAQAEQFLRKAVLVADACGHTEIRAITLNLLIWLVGYDLAKFDAAEQIAEAAAAVIEFSQDRGEILARWHNNLGVALFLKGDLDRALVHHEQALKIRAQVLGPDHTDLGSTQNNIGIVYFQKGDYARAQEHHERALKIWRKVLGPEHPNLAHSHNNLGGVFLQQKNYDQAFPHFQRALEIWERGLGSDHPLLSEPRTGLGEIYLQRQDLPNAIAQFERVLSICGSDKCTGEWEQALAESRFGLAKGLLATGTDRPRALSLARQACELFRHQTTPTRKALFQECESWLKKQRAR